MVTVCVLQQLGSVLAAVLARPRPAVLARRALALGTVAALAPAPAVLLVLALAAVAVLALLRVRASPVTRLASPGTRPGTGALGTTRRHRHQRRGRAGGCDAELLLQL